MTRLARTITAAVAVIAAGVAVGACGGSGGGGTVTVTKTRATSTPASATTGSTTTPSSGAATTTTSPNAQATVSPSGTPACVASMMALRSLGRNGAMGHLLLYFALRNTSSRSCHTYGYPGVLFLGKAGQALPTKVQRTTHDLPGSPTVPLQRLTVAPGDSVYFRLLFADFNGSGSAGCPTAYGLQAIPPDDTHTLRTKISNGVTECGTTTVTPLSATQG